MTDTQADMFITTDTTQPIRTRVPGVPNDVADKFEQLALKISRDGWPKYSARAIMERIRWHMHIEQGNRDFKCNDHWTPVLARWFIAEHPEFDGFFETRRAASDLNSE